MAKEKEGEGNGNTPNSEPDPVAPGGRLDPERLVAEAGSAKAALQRLAYKLNEVERDNKTYRDRIRQLEAQKPDDDAVVLTGDDAKTYKQLLGERTVKDTLDAFTNGQQALDALKQRQSEDALREVAEAAGVNFAVLKLAPGAKELSFKVEGEADKRTVKVEHEKDGKTIVTAFDEFAKTAWPDLQGVLYAQEQQQQKQRFIHQAPGGQRTGRTVSDEDAARDLHRRVNLSL